MCNSPVNKDVELSFFTLQVHIGLLLSRWSIIPSSTAACYVISYSGLIHLMPLLTDPFALLFTEFYLSDFILFFFFQFIKIKINLEPVLRSATHPSASCYLQIYIYFQFINSP